MRDRAAYKREWRRRNRESQREYERSRNDYKRDWERNNRAVCPKCGDPMGAGSVSPSKRYDICQSCHQEEARQRAIDWNQKRFDGWTNEQIAADAGFPIKTVANVLQRSNVERYGLTWTRAPYPKRKVAA